MAPEMHMCVRRAQWFLLLFTTGLILSGLTAFPLKAEAGLLNALAGPGTACASIWPALASWVAQVHRGISDAHQQYPFLFYGTDWLTFAHIVIAIAFLGAIRDPVKNVWVIEFGMIACVLVIPFALLMGGLRGIPFFWRLIDCSFGVFGIIPLWLARHYLSDVRRRGSPDW